MTAVYRKEMRSYLTNMTGAVAVAVMLLVTGLMFRYYNLYYGLLTLHYAISNSALIFYIVVPVLSMRVFAEERRNRTDQLLLTSPCSLTEIVAGKYLALISVFAIPVVVMCFFPLIMNSFGSETLLWDYLCILAFFVMGCAYLAVGMFISSCTENVIIAAVLCILFVFLTQMMSGIFTIISGGALQSLLFILVLALLCGLLMDFMTRNALVGTAVGAAAALALLAAYYFRPSWFGGRTESVLRIFDFATHFEDFAGGSFSLTNLLFFISYIAAGVILTVQSLLKRRWS